MFRNFALICGALLILVVIFADDLGSYTPRAPADDAQPTTAQADDVTPEPEESFVDSEEYNDELVDEDGDFGNPMVDVGNGIFDPSKPEIELETSPQTGKKGPVNRPKPVARTISESDMTPAVRKALAAARERATSRGIPSSDDGVKLN